MGPVDILEETHNNNNNISRDNNLNLNLNVNTRKGPGPGSDIDQHDTKGLKRDFLGDWILAEGHWQRIRFDIVYRLKLESGRYIYWVGRARGILSF